MLLQPPLLVEKLILLVAQLLLLVAQLLLLVAQLLLLLSQICLVSRAEFCVLQLLDCLANLALNLLDLGRNGPEIALNSCRKGEGPALFDPRTISFVFTQSSETVPNQVNAPANSLPKADTEGETVIPT